MDLIKVLFIVSGVFLNMIVFVFYIFVIEVKVKLLLNNFLVGFGLLEMLVYVFY